MSIWDSISLPLSIRYTHQNLPYMLRRYSIWEVVLYRSLPPVFLFPLSLDLFWRLKGLLYGSEMMSLQFSVSSIQFYDNDLLFTFPTWPFWKRNFSQHNSSLFLPARWQVPKWQKNIMMTSGVVCSLVLLEKNLQNHGHIFSMCMHTFGHLFLMTAFQILWKKEVVFNDLFIRLKRKFVVNFWCFLQSWCIRLSK